MGERAINSVCFVVPCYNEEAVLPEFYRRVEALAEELAAYQFSFLFINDGSTDGTAMILDRLAGEDDRVQVIHFAANRGHQIAITAGIDYAEADLLIIIDVDLQDPPELAKAMIAEAESGHDVIHARRVNREGETWFKLFTAWLFYKLLKFLTGNRIRENIGDFRGITRPVAQSIRKFREPHRFMRGLFSEIGYQQVTIEYSRGSRHAGETKYPFFKMLRLAIHATVSFSTFPLKAILLTAVLLWLVGAAYGLHAFYARFVLGITVEGWTSLLIATIFMAGLQLFCLGVMGLYLGKIFEQGQARPLYWIESVRNLPGVERPGSI